jgi:pimeloyl-ACP methyl ester carboxylesterase
MPFESTPTLKIAYEAGGPSNGFPVVLLHGWPDDVRTYDRVVPVLNAAGFRTVVPYLRGFGDTSFLSKETMRSGEIVAMAQDSLDLADALNLQKIRSDWPRLGFTYCLRFGDCHSSAHLPDCDPVGWVATGRVADAEPQTGPSVLVPMVHDDEARSPSGPK